MWQRKKNVPRPKCLSKSLFTCMYCKRVNDFTFQVSLDPPMKQGQTRYPFLVLLFNKDDEMTLELGLPEYVNFFMISYFKLHYIELCADTENRWNLIHERLRFNRILPTLLIPYQKKPSGFVKKNQHRWQCDDY